MQAFNLLITHQICYLSSSFLFQAFPQQSDLSHRSLAALLSSPLAFAFSFVSSFSYYVMGPFLSHCHCPPDGRRSSTLVPIPESAASAAGSSFQQPWTDQRIKSDNIISLLTEMCSVMLGWAINNVSRCKHNLRI